jgi:hypothetical protein
MTSQINDVKRESYECLLLANNNYEYVRRNNLHIGGLSKNPQDTVRPVVAEFCGSKLLLVDFDMGNIDVAHPMPSKQTTQPGSSAASTCSSRQKTKTSVPVIFCQTDVWDNSASNEKVVEGYTFIHC